MKMVIGFAISTLALAVLLQVNSSYGQTSVEVGQVKWNRDLEAAKKIGGRTGKPLFVQFQEVPG